jgi:hypothetical protein
MPIFRPTLGRTRAMGLGLLALLTAFALACGGGDSGSSGGLADTGIGDSLASAQDGGGASGRDNDENLPVDQLILFQIEHVDWAWTRTLEGIYIDRAGNVFIYHQFLEFPEAGQEAFTEEELLGKYSFNKELVDTIDPATVLEKAGYIADASRGSLSEPEHLCHDAGTTTYTAFTYDEATGLYREVLLRQHGDWFRENKSQSAKALYEWLDEVTRSDGGGDSVSDNDESGPNGAPAPDESENTPDSDIHFDEDYATPGLPVEVIPLCWQ